MTSYYTCDRTFMFTTNDIISEYNEISSLCQNLRIPLIISNVDELSLYKLKKVFSFDSQIIEKNGETYTLYDKSIKEELFSLYSCTFDDSYDYTKYFFDNITLKNTYYKRINRQIVSCFFIQNKTFIYEKREIEIPFIIGAVTKQEFRKKGLFKALFSEFINESKKPFCLLSPDIEGFYERLNFAAISFFSSIKEQKITPTDFSSIENIYNNNCKDYYLKRNFEDQKKIWAIDNIMPYITEDKKGYVLKNEKIEEQFYPIYNKDKPLVLGRIVNLSSFCHFFNISLHGMKVVDPLIKKNCINSSSIKEINIKELFLLPFKNKNGLLLDRY